MVVLSFQSTAHTPSATQEPDCNLRTIKAILDLPEDQIDLARAKVAIYHMVHPDTDTKSLLKRLDVVYAKIRARLPANASSSSTSAAILKYAYDASQGPIFSPLRPWYPRDHAVALILNEKLGYLSNSFGWNPKNKKEIVAVFAVDLLESYRSKGMTDEFNALAELTWKYNIPPPPFHTRPEPRRIVSFDELRIEDAI